MANIVTQDVETTIKELHNEYFSDFRRRFPGKSDDAIAERFKSNRMSPESVNRLSMIARLAVAPNGFEPAVFKGKLDQLLPNEALIAEDIIRQNYENPVAKQLLDWATSIRKKSN